METQQKETMALLKQMKPKLDYLSKESGFGQDIPHFPINTDQELLAMERKMDESEDYQKAVVRIQPLLDFQWLLILINRCIISFQIKLIKKDHKSSRTKGLQGLMPDVMLNKFGISARHLKTKNMNRKLTKNSIFFRAVEGNT